MVKYIEEPEIEERDIAKRDVAYYYDSNPIEEDFVLESTVHGRLVHYLTEVLQWHLRDQDYSVYGDLGFYHTPHLREKPSAPDIVVVKGSTFQDVQSWKIGATGAEPLFVGEIGSHDTWDIDLFKKPAKYARMGVKEYVAYDPQTPPIKKRANRRLYGWHLDEATGQMKSMPLDAEGRLWSPLLESFWVPDGPYLRLYDREGHLRLTGEEAETRRADAEALAKLVEKRLADTEAKRADAEAKAKRAEARRADAEKRRADVEAQAKLAEAIRADAEAIRADAEAKRADAEAKAKEVLAEKLRSLGIDPDQI